MMTGDRAFPMLACLGGAALIGASCPADAPTAVHGCADPRVLAAAQSLDRGPLHLVRIDCLVDWRSPFTQSPPIPSPDGNTFAIYDGINGLWTTRAGDARKAYLTGRVTLPPPGVDAVPFAWNRRGTAIWTVRQETTPGGFARGPLVPAMFDANGAPHGLPRLSHSAGPLDQLVWAGGSGKAIATFGTLGGYYRPAHPDPRPTLAIVDAAAGRIVSAVPFGTMTTLPARLFISGMVARTDDQGKVHALVMLAPRQWILWNEGHPPRVMPLRLSAELPVAITSDGTRALIMMNLSATGMICELNLPCPAPTPQAGSFASLIDTRTGRTLWTLTGRAATFSSTSRPAISNDDRFALLSTPMMGGEKTILLVAIDTGRVLQHLKAPATDGSALGFTADGTRAWMSGDGQVWTYRFSR